MGIALGAVAPEVLPISTGWSAVATGGSTVRGKVLRSQPRSGESRPKSGESRQESAGSRPKSGESRQMSGESRQMSGKSRPRSGESRPARGRWSPRCPPIATGVAAVPSMVVPVARPAVVVPFGKWASACGRRTVPFVAPSAPTQAWTIASEGCRSGPLRGRSRLGVDRSRSASGRFRPLFWRPRPGR
jgi:hypothetical protein